MEKRTTIRYPVNCSTVCGWKTSEDREQTSEGMTRDIGMKGVFVVDKTCPPVGTRIELKIAVPNLSGTSHGLHVVATGQVIRIEHLDDNTTNGFAAAVQFDPSAGEGRDQAQPLHEPVRC